jgi:outer membrane immunogenic protein
MRRLSYVLLVACVGASGLGSSAAGQDYGYGATPALHEWRGLYGGAHVGGAWGSTNASDTGSANTLDDYWSAAPSGVVAGIQLGYNWRNGPVLYGVEGDLGYLGLAGSATTTYVPFGYDRSTQTDSDFYLTLRGRLGVIYDQWVFYATGGYIGADTTVSIVEACDDIICGGSFAVSGSNSSFRNGWTLGGGLEGAVGGPWTFKAEYLYYDLGSETITTTGTGATTWNVDTDGSLVRAGLNYRFGGQVGPVN